MSCYDRLNDRSIRLFAATPEELAKKRPNLNAPYFRVKRGQLEKLLATTGGDVVMSLAVWKRKGRNGKPDFFTAEISFPEDRETHLKYLKKDDEWTASHPRTVEGQAERRDYAMNRKAAENIGIDPDEAEELPF